MIQSFLMMEQTTITPTIAKELLKRNTRNRPLNIRRAKVLSEAIKRGEWELNGDTIRISDTGVVLDGQHRLYAIAESGCAVETIVVSGLPDKVFDTIDVGGAARTTGNVLSLAGRKYANQLAALTRMYFIWSKSGDPANGNPDYAPTTAQQLELAKNPEFQKTVEEVEKHQWVRRNMTPAMSGFCLHVFKEHNKQAAHDFFNALNSGAGLSAHSPILLLRDRLIASKLDKQQKLDRRYTLALVFKAFKLFRDDAQVKTLRVRMDGDAPEKDLFVL